MRLPQTMNSMRRVMDRYTRGIVATLILGAGLGTAAAAQDGPSAEGVSVTYVEGGSGSNSVPSDALARGRYAVVIDLDENLLHFRRGEMTLWTAPIGTGTGLMMQDHDDRDWDFSTPNGVFQVQFKERDPVWIAEDWYFIENGLPVPPPNDRSRYFPGGLGAAAVYFSRELAIHGTDKPELLGQRVSHGCIRLSNADALRLYHNVQVGTEVVIVGGEDIPQVVITPAEARRLAEDFRPATPRPTQRDPLMELWRGMTTRQLSLVLQSELRENPNRSRWPEVAHLLWDRGITDAEVDALAGLMRAGLDLPTNEVELEYRTFLANAYARNGPRTLEALAQFDELEQAKLAAMIVDAAVGLYNGDLQAPSAPWPTRRVARSVVDDEVAIAWDALRAAEKAFQASEAQAFN